MVSTEPTDFSRLFHVAHHPALIGNAGRGRRLSGVPPTTERKSGQCTSTAQSAWILSEELVSLTAEVAVVMPQFNIIYPASWPKLTQ